MARYKEALYLVLKGIFYSLLLPLFICCLVLLFLGGGYCLLTAMTHILCSSKLHGALRGHVGYPPQHDLQVRSSFSVLRTRASP